MKMLNNELINKIKNGEAPIYHASADAKEAVLFAVLANESIAGDFSALEMHLPQNTPKVSFGKISLPG